MFYLTRREKLIIDICAQNGLNLPFFANVYDQAKLVRRTMRQATITIFFSEKTPNSNNLAQLYYLLSSTAFDSYGREGRVAAVGLGCLICRHPEHILDWIQTCVGGGFGTVIFENVFKGLLESENIPEDFKEKIEHSYRFYKLIWKV